MTAISLDSQIKKFLPLLGDEQKELILGMIKSYITVKEEPSERMTIEQYNKELDEAEARVNAGFFTSHEDVLKEAKSW